MRLAIRSGRALVDGRFHTIDIVVNDADVAIAPLGAASPDRLLDASGLLVLPGIVDIHGDAFERQIEPRPHVAFDVDIALIETDRQLVANGITTAYHGVTWSWEPGLRGPEMARALLEALERLRPQLAADTRYHLRHETFNLDAEPQICRWLAEGRLGCLAFNDHMSGTIKNRHRPEKMARMVERAGIGHEAFQGLVDRTWARRDEVPGSISRLAAAAMAVGVPVLSHDDATPADRSWYRNRGARISEFPTTVAATEAAIAGNDATVFGAPNVVRGGSHTGCPSAAEMVQRGLCTILASDYYYPALLLAPFRLESLGAASLETAWSLVSSRPAEALGLTDRGVIAEGRRADLVLVDAAASAMPRVVATICGGRIVFLSEAHRLDGGPTRTRFATVQTR